MSDGRAAKLQNIGLRLTYIYIILLLAALPSFAYLGWMKLESFEFNQLGDFLAGVFGPVAIFWLVLGFMQQGEELRHSVEALQLQAEELRHSVEAQRELVEVSRAAIVQEREQAVQDAARRKAENAPEFRVEFVAAKAQSGIPVFNLTIINCGGRAVELTVVVWESVNSGGPIVNKHIKVVSVGESIILHSVPRGLTLSPVRPDFLVSIEYYDADRDHFSREVTLSYPR